jgi:hypothetical protein
MSIALTRSGFSIGLLVPDTTRTAVNGPVETNAPTATPGPKPLLLDGCEPMVSAIGQSPLAQIAGRCVS